MYHVHAWFLQRPEDGVCSIWVLGIEFRSFWRVANAFAELSLLPLVSRFFVFVTLKENDSNNDHIAWSFMIIYFSPKQK